MSGDLAPSAAVGRGPVRRAVRVVLLVAWLPIVILALSVSDDHNEVLLDLLLLALGLLAAGVLLGGRLQGFREQLHRAERRVRAMGSSNLLPWECDAHGRITYFGDRAEEYFGYPAEELLGLPLADLVHPQELARLGALLQLKVGWQDERWRCIRKDGTDAWFMGSAHPIIAADGLFVGYSGSAHPLGQNALDEQRLSEIASRVYDRIRSEDLLTVFQPILSVGTGRLIGAEALSRFPGSDLRPDQWFEQAAEAGLSHELELLALRRALDAAQALPRDIYISVNVGPHTLVRAGLVETLLRSPIAPERVVVEITEHASIAEYGDIAAVVDMLRARGMRLAVDDAGAGYASFRHILRLSPEIIKLDRSLIAGLHDDRGLRALAAAVVAFGSETGASITAEGIETPEELRCAQDLGIHAAQGYLLGRPTDDWTTWNEWHARGPLYSVTAAQRPDQQR